MTTELTLVILHRAKLCYHSTQCISSVVILHRVFSEKGADCLVKKKSTCVVTSSSSLFKSLTCVLQCVAVCYSVLQCVAVCCSVLQCVHLAMCCRVLQCAEVCSSV